MLLVYINNIFTSYLIWVCSILSKLMIFPFMCRVIRTRSEVIASHFSTCDKLLLCFVNRFLFLLMTSVHVIGSHSFGKIVNKRHFVQRFISWISSKKARG